MFNNYYCWETLKNLKTIMYVMNFHVFPWKALTVILAAIFFGTFWVSINRVRSLCSRFLLDIIIIIFNSKQKLNVEIIGFS